MAAKKKTKKKPRLRSYHFSLGNSTKGPIGFCARVKATTKALAVAKLRDLLPADLPVGDDSGGEYIRVYFNPDMVRASDIDDSEELVEPEPEEIPF